MCYNDKVPNEHSVLNSSRIDYIFPIRTNNKCAIFLLHFVIARNISAFPPHKKRYSINSCAAAHSLLDSMTRRNGNKWSFESRHLFDLMKKKWAEKTVVREKTEGWESKIIFLSSLTTFPAGKNLFHIQGTKLNSDWMPIMMGSICVIKSAFFLFKLPLKYMCTKCDADLNGTE